MVSINSSYLRQVWFKVQGQKWLDSTQCKGKEHPSPWPHFLSFSWGLTLPFPGAMTPMFTHLRSDTLCLIWFFTLLPQISVLEVSGQKMLKVTLIHLLDCRQIVLNYPVAASECLLISIKTSLLMRSSVQWSQNAPAKVSAPNWTKQTWHQDPC